MKRAKKPNRRAVVLCQIRTRVYRAAEFLADCLGTTVARVLELSGVTK